MTAGEAEAPGGEVDEGAGAFLLADVIDATRRLTDGAIDERGYEERLRLLWGRWLDRVRDCSEGEKQA